MNKLYLLKIDSSGFFDFQQFHKKLTQLQTIQDWWQYISDTYILETYISAAELTNQIIPLLGDRTFILIEVNPGNANGRLPISAWEWINNKARPG
jgi:hypothetical protein